jgi:hypothetical protein
MMFSERTTLCRRRFGGVGAGRGVPERRERPSGPLNVPRPGRQMASCAYTPIVLIESAVPPGSTVV